MPQVLVADDSPTIRLLVRLTLTPEGYSVLEAADGDEAWTMLREHHPAAAILDVTMPGRDGPELTRMIRAEPEFDRMAVILLSGHGDEAHMREALEAGADQYLTKPFLASEFLGELKQALARR